MKIVADLDLPFVQPYFAPLGELVLKPGRLLTRNDVIDADALLVRSVTPVNESLLRQTAVKFVGSMTTGLDHLDTAWLRQAGIRWQATVGYNAEAVADYLMAVVAALWERWEAGATPRVGVVGVGQVGSRVAERFKILGWPVLLCDPLRAEAEKDFASVDLLKLCELELLTLHTPLTVTENYPTYHLLSQAFFSKMPADSLLINTGRGAVIDSAALKAAGRQKQGCFDVWEKEPAIDLELLSSVLLATPHIAGHSVQTRYRGIQELYQAFCESFAYQPQLQSLPKPPQQRLAFGGRLVGWQEVVLTIFDPRALTQVMKTLLLKEPAKCATLFDKLRQDTIGEGITRQEFASTTIAEVRLAERDREVLTQFGITIEE